MSGTTSRYLQVASGHIDSLISYVLDVKPYHTKLSEIVEEYLFEDNVNVKMTEEHSILSFLGADILPSSLSTPGVRVRRSNSWFRDITSDGTRRIWPVPLTSVHKLASHSNEQRFTAGIDDDSQIAGVGIGVYNQKRWEGPGITSVLKNDVHQQESSDYFLSHGVYSFNTHANQRWKESNVEQLSQYAENPGELFYQNVMKAIGTIKNIGLGNYEEWTLTCISISPAVLEVRGSASGVIGTAAFNVPFVNPLLEFEFTFAPSAPGESISIDDYFTLTPFNKITVDPLAPEETWSIVKVNPIVFDVPPTFIPGTNPGPVYPSIEVHTRSLDRVTEPQEWAITFAGDGTYSVTVSSLSTNYSVGGLDLKDGCSFKNNDIHFTLIATTNGFYAGDSFTFTLTGRTENFLVFGSVSGWQPNAKLDEWYWNGKIGFKIPKLEYFAEANNSTVVVSDGAVQNTWAVTVSNSQVLRSIDWDPINSAFFATGDGSIVGASADGVTWLDNAASLITPTPNHFVVITGEGGVIAVSEDGILWEKQPTNTTVDLHASTEIPNFLTPLPYPPAIPNSLNCLIVVGDAGTILTSINGTAWADQNSGTTQDLHDITWSNDAIIAVGNAGTILRSLDRITWTPILSGTVNNLRAIVYEPSVFSFIAVGDNGTILRSVDGGQTWLNISAFSDGRFTDITFGEGKFVAVGPDGWIATSTNGATWSRYQGSRLNSIAYGNGVFVGVGGSHSEVTNFTELKSVHSMAEPSVYTIEFRNATQAIVKHNIHGYKKGLTVGQDWEDEFVAFRINPPDLGQYSPGDVFNLYLAPKYDYIIDAGFDESLYEEFPYDTSIIDLRRPWLYNEEYFPLYHSHGSVIFRQGVIIGDKFIVDKATKDVMRFKIIGASTYLPELAAIDDWIPLEFRYYDRLIGGVPTSEANFSDLTTYIEAYLCADPSVRVLSIAQPRHSTSNRNASAVITFDEDFYTQYMGFSIKYSMLFMPDSVYGQKIRVKVTENLRTFARVNFFFDDAIMLVNIEDGPVQHWEMTNSLEFVDLMDAQFIEGGALPYINGYDILPFDVAPYDQNLIYNGVLAGFVESSPGVYDYTGNAQDFVIPKQVDSPSFYTERQQDPELAGTSFREGLFIQEIESSIVEQLSTLYDVSIDTPAGGLLIPVTANSYLITHNGSPVTPTLIVESLSNLGVYGNPLPNMNPYDQIPAAIGTKSFTFSLPIGFTVPFKLTVV